MGQKQVWAPKNLKKRRGGPNFAPKTPKMATKCNFGLERARDLILVSIPRFSGMGNPLGPFSDIPDWPGSPNRHLWPFMTTKIWQNGQICNFCSEHARDLILVSIPRFSGKGNPLGPFSDTFDWPEWPNRHLWPFMTTKIWLNSSLRSLTSRSKKISHFK